MHRGYVKLWRRVDTSEVSSLPHSHFRVWCWILTNVTHKPTTVAGLDLEPGEMLTTYGRIAMGTEWKENRTPQRLSIRQLRTALQHLVKLQMLEQRQEQRQGCLRLKVLHWDEYQGIEDRTATGTKTELRQDFDRTATGEQEGKKVRTTRKKEISIGQNGHEPEGFVAWWEVYPRKVGKGAARVAYAKALKRCPSDTLLSALQEQLPELRKREPQFVANPTTWLNQERWADEGFIPRDPAVNRIANLRKLRAEMGDERVKAMCETQELWEEVVQDA